MNVDEATRVLCYTDTDFRVREWVLHNRQWQGGHAHNTIVYADQQTPLAMISIDLGNNIKGIRVYYIHEGRIKEDCFDGTLSRIVSLHRTWFKGALTDRELEPLDISRLAVTIGRLNGRGKETGKLQHIVVYQDAHLNLKEDIKIGCGEWESGWCLPVPPLLGAKRGTGIAAIWKDGKAHVYFQATDNGIYEATRENGTWNLSEKLFEARPNTPLAVGLSSKKTIHLFYVNDQDCLSTRYRQGSDWMLEGGNASRTVSRNSSISVCLVPARDGKEIWNIVYVRAADAVQRLPVGSTNWTSQKSRSMSRNAMPFNVAWMLRNYVVVPQPSPEEESDRFCIEHIEATH
ncbi:hypothetical protein FPOAC2_07262 [Fusarium poae]